MFLLPGHSVAGWGQGVSRSWAAGSQPGPRRAPGPGGQAGGAHSSHRHEFGEAPTPPCPVAGPRGPGTGSWRGSSIGHSLSFMQERYSILAFCTAGRSLVVEFSSNPVGRGEAGQRPEEAAGEVRSKVPVSLPHPVEAFIPGDSLSPVPTGSTGCPHSSGGDRAHL